MVKQEQLRDIYGNGDLVAIPHSHPVQVYPKSTFDAMNVIPLGAKQNGFADLGIQATVLWGDGTTDEEVQLTTAPVAETVVTEANSIAKTAVEMVNEGTTLTPAEEFKEKSEELAAEAGTQSLDESEALKEAKPVEKKAEPKK